MTLLEQVDALTGSGVAGAEGRFLASLAARVAAEHCIVEIGSYKGKSACYLAYGAQGVAHVYAVDVWDPDHHGKRSIFADSSILDQWHTQVDSVDMSSLISPIRGRSIDVAAAWAGPSIGLLFIDGDHHYGAALADLTAWTPHLAEHATVCVHDYGNPRWVDGCTKMVNDHLTEANGWHEFEVVGRIAKVSR